MNYTCTLLFLILVFSSCRDAVDCCVIIDTDVSIHYVDAGGNDLVNSSPDFDENRFKVFFKKDDEFEEINRGRLDHPRMFSIYDDDKGRKIMQIFPSDYYEGNTSTTLIKLNSLVVDTLVCAFEIDDNSIICTSATLNGISMPQRFLTVIH